MYLLLNGFNLLGLNPFWQVILLGILLIYVVGQENILRGLRAFFGRKGVQRRA
jgi:ribose/xylose/arabinose/galactoside ABC-type transport system permease subunit